MEKLDKVIAGLGACNGVGENCNNCPYNGEGETCSDVLWADALAMLQKMKKKYASALEAATIAAELVAKYRKVDGDLISRSDVLKYPLRRDTCDKKNANPHFVNGIESVMEYVETLPAAPAEPVTYARWKGAGLGDYLCSACWEVCSGGDRFKRCPHCGAHMDEEVADG